MHHHRRLDESIQDHLTDIDTFISLPLSGLGFLYEGVGLQHVHVRHAHRGYCSYIAPSHGKSLGLPFTTSPHSHFSDSYCQL